MRTVDVLTKARDLLADKKNWGKSWLAALNPDGTSCFCALGAVLKEGGVLQAALRSNYFNVARPLWVEYVPQAGLQPSYIYGIEEDDLEGFDFSSLVGTGVHLRATKRAQDYLSAAVWDMHQAGITVVNDSSSLGHAAIMRAFDLAIRRAKRRHKNGG